MAKSKLVKANEKIAEGVTTGFKKMSDAVVEGYTKIEDKFVDEFLTKDKETVSDAKKRLKQDKNVMMEPPRKLTEPIMNKQTVIKSILQGFVIFLVVFGSYYYLIQRKAGLDFASTFSFTILVLANIFVVYVLQSKEYAYKNFLIDLKDKIIVLINSVIVIVLLLLIYVPTLNQIVGMSSLNIYQLIIAILLALISTISFDLLKKKNKILSKYPSR